MYSNEQSMEDEKALQAQLITSILETQRVLTKN